MKLFRLFILLFSILNAAFVNLKITDANGVESSFNEPLGRVACISPSVTELIYAIGADDKLLANSRYCRFPEKAMQKIKIGGYLDPDFEKIAQIKPDLFLLTMSKEDIFSSKLDKFNIAHLYLYSDGLENILKNIDILAKVFDKEENGRLLIEKIQESISLAKEKAKSFKTKRAILLFGQMSAGKSSYASELLEIAGATNIMANSTSPWLVPEKEHIIASAPEIIILEAKSPQDFKLQRDFYIKDPIWQKTPAVKNNKIYPINSDLISIPCSHIIGALGELSAIMQEAN